MKQFTLEEYLKNPEKKIVTRNGCKARIICTDRNSFEGDTILSLISTAAGETVRSHYTNGIAPSTTSGAYDLFFVAEKKTNWINVYKNHDGKNYGSYSFFDTEEKARNYGKNCDNYITTVKIEYEE